MFTELEQPGDRFRITDYTSGDNMNVFSRVLVAMITAVAALFVSTGTSRAGLDIELQLAVVGAPAALPHE